ncbi:site-specific integrase [Geovibrio thiophilus]|uniref:Site-specific integrase n=1 Tax=Geovibrio thiophilus TaxID=139438 RepID=A0A3R6AWC2_9BACT|nr:site-specific integrase [Geovibrio thiophilus]QAR32034.1 site-specific integrase [Geovibrio thiophilus]
MAIFNRCECRTFNSTQSKNCKSCGEKLSKNYYIQYSIDGKRKTEKIGDSIGYAREALAKRKTDVRENRFFGITKTILWKTFFNTYYKDYYKNHLTDFHRGRFESARDFKDFDKSMNNISRTDIENYRNFINNGKRSPATVNRYLQVVKFAFNYAESLELIDRNPVRKLPMLQEQPKERNVLSSADEKKLLAECRNSRSPILYHFVMVALYTGMRYSEVINLKWSNISFEENSIRIYKTKNNQPREIPIINSLKPVLIELHSLTGKYEYIFSRPTDGQRLKDLSGGFEKAVERAQLNIVFHELRHTMITRLAASGASIIEIQQISGHKTAKMIERYTHVGLKESKRTIERLGSYLSVEEN